MKLYLILRILLALHITGLVTMAGTTIVDYITFNTFWKFADEGDNRSLGLLPLMARYGALVRTGAAMLVITGITMLILVKGAWWGQLWFKIKMALVILLVLNGMLIGNKQGTKFRQIVSDNTSGFMQQTADVRITLHRFYLIQLGIFFIIILISAVKFDCH
ncbi:hypothetical protein [Chitinophaga sp. ARDCPP14]|uniref:hypothetical protein n=1 Tax=Chitinophaga sp. ARDCPP14 TaxID=3391139 RepID=UPI003F5278FC